MKIIIICSVIMFITLIVFAIASLKITEKNNQILDEIFKNIK